MSKSAETSLVDPKDALAGLASLGAQSLDPVTFQYLEALIARIPAQRASVARHLENKVRSACRQLESTLSEAQKEGEAIVAKIARRFPQEGEQAQGLLREKKYQALRRLDLRLLRAQQRQQSRSALNKLTHLLLQEPTRNEAKPDSLETLLAAQEQQLFEDTENVSRLALKDLPSAAHIRAALGQLQAEQLIERALLEIPKDAGPLNTQRLVADSLATMRTLSSAYARRFVAHTETILWLHDAGKKSSTKK